MQIYEHQYVIYRVYISVT